MKIELTECQLEDMAIAEAQARMQPQIDKVVEKFIGSHTVVMEGMPNMAELVVLLTAILVEQGDELEVKAWAIGEAIELISRNEGTLRFEIDEQSGEMVVKIREGLQE